MHDATKRCPTCGVEKPHGEYGKNKSRSDGLSFYCKPCLRARDAQWRAANPHQAELNRERLSRLRIEDPDRYFDYLYRSKFGISLAEYEALLAGQGGGCAICGHQPQGDSPRLAVDHDHACCPGRRSCGRCVRGLLCASCNNGLGRFKDSPALLRRALEYVTD